MVNMIFVESNDFQNGGVVVIYKQFKDIKLSALGMGCMRFPLMNDGSGKIDEEQTAAMIDYAMKNGVNYSFSLK